MAKVMVVEDDKAVVTLVSFLMEKSGHEVVSASNGVEALEALAGMRSTPPDVILLDIMMPKMDGYALNAKLQADPDYKAIPIVVLTAKGGMKDLFEVAPNVSDYIEKPFDPAVLRKTVEEILKKRTG